VSGQHRPSSIAVDATSVYWINDSSAFDSEEGSVLRARLEGGAPEVLVDRGAAPSSEQMIAPHSMIHSRAARPSCALRERIPLQPQRRFGK
jgi:hypothetical protein